MDKDVENCSHVATVAVRPLIRQPRAIIRADDSKSPNSSRSECGESKIDSTALPRSFRSASRELFRNSEADFVVADDKLADTARSISTEFGSVQDVDSVSEDVVQVQEADDMSKRQVSEAIVPESEAQSSSSDNSAEIAEDRVAKHVSNESCTGAESAVDTCSVETGVGDDSATAAEKSTAEQVDERSLQENSELDCLNETMIVKNDSRVEDEMMEGISNWIFDKLVQETIDLTLDMISQRGKQPAPCSSVTSVLERVSSILAEYDGKSSKKGNLQQLYLTTTFDLSSPEERTPTSSNFAQLKQIDSFDLTSADAIINSVQPVLPADVTSREGQVALQLKLDGLNVESEWIDDEIESGCYVVNPVAADSIDKSHIKVIEEAEALEREQKRIEQEIQRLSESVLYLREIPNKPPPPYTPPGQALNWQKSTPANGVKLQTVQKNLKEDSLVYCRRFAEYLIDHGEHTQYPDEFFDVDLKMGQESDCRTNGRAYLVFLAELTRHFTFNLNNQITFSSDFKRHVKQRKAPLSREGILEQVQHQILVEFNQRPRFQKDNLLTKWSQRKSDRVDEILVKELQLEEKHWSDFGQEEVQVKRQTADAILDLLIGETVELCKRLACK